MNDAAAPFRAAFSSHRAALAAQGEARLRRIFERAVQALGPSLRGVYNHPDFARTWSETMKHVTAYQGARGELPAALDEARLRAFCDEWAGAELEDAAQKLAAKVSGLLDVEVLRSSGSEWFAVSGRRASGERVSVLQDQITNVSSKGKLFNQWPARIYVNGKQISEAAYKRMG